MLAPTGLTAEQIEFRRTGLTATDMVIISGFSRWGHPLEVWESKMGAPPKPSTRAMKMGHAAESVIADEVAERFGLKIWPGATIRDRIVDYYLATPDRFVGERAPVLDERHCIFDGYEPEAVVECKLVGRQLVGEWFEKGEDGGEVRVFPASVAVQTCWQMGVSRARRSYVGAFLGGWQDDDTHFIAVDFDEELWAHLKEAADRFWRDHVLPKRPPPPDSSDRARDALGRIYPAAKKHVLVEADEDAIELMRRYREAQAQVAAAEKVKKEVGNLLRARIGEAEVDGLICDEGKATWLPTSGKIDWERLCEAYGISAAEQEKFRRPGGRTLRVGALTKKELGYRRGLAA
jgi:predicted phage-related endonuclease